MIDPTSGAPVSPTDGFPGTPGVPEYDGSAISRGKIVPLISSYVAGPLGLIHLPRLWLKSLLHATGLLPEDWGCGPGGLDKRIMDFVGLDPATFVPWLLQTFPPYEECEAYVRANARHLSAETIARSNAMLRSHPLPRGLGPQFRAYLGVEDPSVDVGIMLNNLDDWEAVRRYALEHRETLEPIVPAISPGTTGPLGVVHLPRWWMKRFLRAAGALPAGYAHAEEPADRAVLERLGIDPAAAEAFVAAELPAYVAFEAWIRGAADTAQIAAANAAVAAGTIAAVEAYDRALLHEMLRARRAADPAAVQAAGIFAFRR